LQWDLNGDSSPTILLENPRRVESVNINSDGNSLIIGDSEGSIKILNLYRGIVSASFPGNPGSILSVAVSRNGKSLLSGGNDIRLWNLDYRKLLEVFSEHSHQVLAVVFNSQGDKFVSSSQDGTIKIWQDE